MTLSNIIGATEVSCLVAVYETVSVVKDNRDIIRYHEQTMCAQKSFHTKVKLISDVVKELGILSKRSQLTY